MEAHISPVIRTSTSAVVSEAGLGSGGQVGTEERQPTYVEGELSNFPQAAALLGKVVLRAACLRSL